MKKTKVIGAGLLISCLGALPLGVLNVTAFDISATRGFESAFFFALAVIVVELFYVRFSLWGNKKWTLNEQWIAPLLLFGCLFLLYLSLSNLLDSSTVATGYEEQGWASAISSPILLGFLLSATNPLQFPFWLGWNKALSRKGILQENSKSYSLYMLGIGSGTFLALLLFIWMGASLGNNYQIYAQYSAKIMGAIYLGFSIYLLFLFYRRRNLKPVVK